MGTKKPFIFACALWLLTALGMSSPVAAGGHGAPNNVITVYIFLMEDCPISQNYAPTLRDMYEYFDALGGFEFKGYFPNKLSNDSTIAAFKQTYNFLFPLYKDEGQAMAKKLKATVAPEAVVVNETTQEILYRGRIDDLYFALKKKRHKAANHDLRNALQNIYDNMPVPVKETTPVGCFITFQ